MTVIPVTTALTAPTANPAAASPAPMVHKFDVIFPWRIGRGGLCIGTLECIRSIELIGSIQIGKTGRRGYCPWRDCNQRFGLARQRNTEGCSSAGAQQACNE
jgi:hypothetical protein